MITIEELRAVPTFSELDDRALEWLGRHADELVIEKGNSPFESGSSATHMMILISGTMQIFVGGEGRLQLFDTIGPGTITGMLPYSRMVSFRGKVIAINECRIGAIAKEHFTEMLYQIPELGQPLIALMSDRVRLQANDSQQREKMMALGKLSAGLAHELNNPAAAIGRAAAKLRERLDTLPGVAAKLTSHGLGEHQICSVDTLRLAAATRIESKFLSAVERSEREDELIDWLEAREIDKSWILADTFAEAGISPDDLDHAYTGLPASAVADLTAWLEGSLAAEKLLAEIESAAKTVSELVASVKGYSHMDQSVERQPTDLRVGIENTIKMLEHKIRSKDIRVERDFDPELPLATVYPGELNQVWTNLIDNAIDAVDDSGLLRIEANLAGEVICIRIIDNGSGIEPEIVSRIFDPFFTTKGVGEGTGLGLDIVERIVRRRHSGTIKVDSRPGRTVFEVQLPLTTKIV